MDDPIARELAQWTVFYGLIGGIAATLLGLLFVALSLRLAIFHQREVADVRDFATFTFGTFLVTMAVALLAVAPHEQGGALTVLLLLAGTAGLLMTGWVTRAWIRVSRGMPGAAGRFATRHRETAMATGCLGLLYLGLLVAAGLVWRGHPQALGWLAVVEAALLGMGAVAAWILLAHATGGSDQNQASGG